MDCLSNFARMARLGALTLALPGVGVSTALAQQLYARPVGALCAARSMPTVPSPRTDRPSTASPDGDRGEATGPRSIC